MKIEAIVIHCSASKWGSAHEIRLWHLQRGFRDIGYHFVIGNGMPVSNVSRRFSFLDGSVEVGRPVDDDGMIEPNEIGAHALGQNDKSIGVCLIGIPPGRLARNYGEAMATFTPKQLAALKALVADLRQRWGLPITAVKGHYEVQTDKPLCPGLEMGFLRQWLNT